MSSTKTGTPDGIAHSKPDEKSSITTGCSPRSASSYTMWLPMYPAPPVIRIAIAIALWRMNSLWKRPSTCLKLRNKLPSGVLSKPMPRTTLEVRWGSFLIKRLRCDAGGGVGRWQNRLRLDPPLEFIVQPLDHIGVVRSDAIIFWALLASGQINMRKVDGWQTLATAP